MIEISHLLTPQALTAFVQVIVIDLVLAGDNAVIIGLAAAGLPKHQRGRAILVGILAATVLRIAFAFVAIELLAIVGLLFAGGILLLWVCWKMWRELRGPNGAETEAALTGGECHVPQKTFAQAARWMITSGLEEGNHLVWPRARKTRSTISVGNFWVQVLGRLSMPAT